MIPRRSTYGEVKGLIEFGNFWERVPRLEGKGKPSKWTRRGGIHSNKKRAENPLPIPSPWMISIPSQED